MLVTNSLRIIMHICVYHFVLQFEGKYYELLEKELDVYIRDINAFIKTKCKENQHKKNVLKGLGAIGSATEVGAAVGGPIGSAVGAVTGFFAALMLQDQTIC